MLKKIVIAFGLFISAFVLVVGGLYAKGGLFRSNLGHWKAYKKADFHPAQQSALLSEQWLENNTSAYSLVGRSS